MDNVSQPREMSPANETEQVVEELVGQWAGDREKLITAMLAIQDKFNWLPPDALDYMARRLNVPKAQVYHIGTFYKVFSLVPRGKHMLHLCMGTACHVRGAPLIADALEREHGIPMGGTSKDGLFTLERVNCVGACAIGPVLLVDGKYYGGMTQNRAGAIIKRLRRQAKKEEHHA